MPPKKPFRSLFHFSDLPDLNNKWRLFLTLGILLVILGALAITFSSWTTLLTVELLGFLLLVGGIFQIISGIQARKWTGVSLSMLLAVLYIVIGAFCIFKPMDGATGFTLLLAVFFFISGLFRITSSLVQRFEEWQWQFISGFISLILGIFVIAEWPLSALWLIGLFVGVDLILIGWNWILLSLSASKHLK